MKYLPITLIATLSASLAVALFFTPTLGALLGKASPVPHDERGRADSGLYMRTVRLALRHPGMTLALAALPAGRGAGRLRQVRPRRRVLPQRRARLRPGDRACARQSLARREEPADRPRSRSACSHSTASRPSTPASASSRAAWARSPRTPSASSSSSSPIGARARRRTRSWTRSAPRPPTFPASWSR